MAWSAPMTAVANTVWTSTQWNTFVRDNMQLAMTHLASTAGSWFVATGANAIAQRSITSDTDLGVSTRTNTAYGALADALATAVTVTTGTRALVMWTVQMRNDTADAQTFASVAVSGGTTISASDTWASCADGKPANMNTQLGMVHLFAPDNGISSNGLNANVSNTFTLQYRSTAGTATYERRHIAVIAF